MKVRPDKMELNKLIEVRRSVRSYKENQTIAKETVEEILKAAQMGPTWKNSQTPRFYAVMSPEKVKEVKEKCLPPFNQNSSANAPVLIVETFVKDVAGFTQGKPDNELANEWGAYDLGCQTGYLILKAADLGLDTLIMGIRDAGAIAEVLGIDKEKEEICTVLALGERAGEPVFRPRKELGEVAKFF